MERALQPTLASLLVGLAFALSAVTGAFAATAPGAGGPQVPDGDPVSLGTADGPNGPVEGYAFVLTEEEIRQVGRSAGGSGDQQCFEVFADGTRWRSVEPYRFDATNEEGLDESTLDANFAGDVARWERAAGVDVLGEAVDADDEVSVDRNRPDGRNEVVFGSVDARDAVAVTVIWGVFSGAPERRKLTEWDMAFDAVDYDWSLTGAPDALDFDSIATHELGHAMGLAHPDPACTTETMYRYTAPGSTAARSLEDGDRAGIRTLYAPEDDDGGDAGS